MNTKLVLWLIVTRLLICSLYLCSWMTVSYSMCNCPDSLLSDYLQSCGIHSCVFACVCVCSTLCLPSRPHPRSAHQQDSYPTLQCSLAATVAASLLSAAAAFLKPQAPKPHPWTTTSFPPRSLVARTSFSGERTRLRPLTAAIHGDRCTSLTAFPFQQVLTLHPFHQNHISFAVLSQWSRCPDPAHFQGKYRSFSAAGKNYHAPPICTFWLWVDKPKFSIYITDKLGI